jgi:hypothetical protein
MYIDSLTITALVLFVVAISVFVRFCMIRHCGLNPLDKRGGRSTTTRERQG